MNDAEKAYQYFVIAVPENEEQAKAYFWARKALQSTLTPPNEWVEALEAINNAAVAYIEGGPYENDLPGMELAVEIDRLSRDFVRPPNEPLTLEQLREMDGESVWVEDVKHWALIDIEKGGQWDGVPFAIWAENGMKFTYNIKNRGLHCYRRPPEGEA